MDNLELEAKVIGKYLLGELINKKAIDLYVQAIKKLNFSPSAKDNKRIAIALKYPFLIPYIDGGLVIVDCNSVVRKKFFTMLAILESIPTYSDKFLPRNFSAWYCVKILFTGLRGIFRGMVGYLLVKLI